MVLEDVEELEPCGCCGCYHRKGYDGECRVDAERFPVPFLPYPGYDTPQCENCDLCFKPDCSDSSDPRRYCSKDCENDHYDKRHMFDGDTEFLLDHDHTLDH